MTQPRAACLALLLAASLALVPAAGARVFTIPTAQPFSLPSGVSGALTPAPNIDPSTIFGPGPRDYLTFRVKLDAGSGPLKEVRATVPDRLTIDGLGYDSSFPDRSPDGIGIVTIGDIARWFWLNPPPFENGARSPVLIAAYPFGDLPGSVGGAFLFIDTNDAQTPGPDHVHLVESLCGNGVVDGGGSFFPETCDDGNRVDDDCCSESCVLAGDGDSCSDHTDCTVGETCAAGVCGGSTPVTCGACEQCVAHGGCVPGFRLPSECRTPFVPGRGKLTLRNKSADTGDLAVYKWLKGSATATADFGNPLTSDGWDFCVFDGTGHLLIAAAAPEGGTCGSKPCWKALGARGFLYKDKARTPGGVDKLTLKSGADGFASAIAVGKGPLLHMPTLGSLTFPLFVELQGHDDQCLFSYFEPQNASRNDSVLFRGKSTD